MGRFHAKKQRYFNGDDDDDDDDNEKKTQTFLGFNQNHANIFCYNEKKRAKSIRILKKIGEIFSSIRLILLEKNETWNR